MPSGSKRARRHGGNDSGAARTLPIGSRHYDHLPSELRRTRFVGKRPIFELGHGRRLSASCRYAWSALSSGNALCAGSYAWRHQPTLGRHPKVGRIRTRSRSSCSENGTIPTGGNGVSNPDPLSRREEGDCGGLLFRKRSWTADERTAPKIKPQEAVRIPRDADPDALPDFAGFVITAPET